MTAATPSILITGVNEGIGLALAQQYHQRGAYVLGIGRRSPEMLEPWLQQQYCQVDITNPDSPANIATWLTQRGISRLDVVIHNAGIGWYGSVAEQPDTSVDQILATNLSAPIRLTHHLLPWLIQASGKVVFIGSVAAAFPVPPYAIYGASKAGLEGFARSLQIELAGQVGVQIIHPGATRTNIHHKSGVPTAPIKRNFPSADQVASQIIKQIDRNQGINTIGWANRSLRTIARSISQPFDQLMMIREQRRPSLSKTPITQPTSQPQLKHCVITGGADGIGRALALHYARTGMHITILDRDRTKADEVCQLIQAAGGQARWLPMDLANINQIQHGFSILTQLPAIDLLIHCAGISAVGPFAKQPLASQLQVLDINLRAPLYLTKLALMHQQLAPHACIVFLASLSVFTSYPGAAVYAASKDGLTAYARSLRIALAPYGGHVLTVFPGPTRTAHARRYSPDNRREGQRMAPEQLAQQIAAAVQQRHPRLIPGFANQLFAWIGHYFPTITAWVMRKSIFEKFQTIHES